MKTKQSNIFTHLGYTVKRHAASHTQHSAEITDKNGVNLFGGNIDAGIDSITHYKVRYGMDGRANPFMSTDKELKDCITKYDADLKEYAPGLIRKLADANVKDLSSNEVARAFKPVVMPRVCITRATVLISSGLITMDKINELIYLDALDHCITDDSIVKINGYEIRYNPMFDRFITSHPEIGAGLGEWATTQTHDIIDYCLKG